jgi:HD-GYP domain-containing protein (c-di-GMP phosphodiesterase class II)
VAGVLAVAALLPTVVLAATGTHMLMLGSTVHILVVGAAGSIAAASAITMSVIAARRHDGRALWIGMAFAIIALLLLVHGLATPGVLVPNNGLVQITGGFNLPFSGFILAASALPWFRRPHDVRRLLRIELVLIAVLAIAGTISLLLARDFPLISVTPTSGRAIFVVGAAPLAVLAWRAARTYLLTRRVLDLCVAEGITLLIGAQYALLAYTMMDAAWWAGHALEVTGIALVGIPTALDLRHAVASRPLVGDLRAGDLVEHEEAFLGGRVRALLLRLAEKDPSTAGHTRRVATLAVAIGERLGLAEGRLRQLALGGLLHDMGKLAVPNEILNKPGRLTDQEFAQIRRHPGAGRELLAELGGFSPLVLDLVQSHHERLDGTGYPDRVPAGDLDLAVRILTVADVYDALTADRVYRDAWPAERALELLDAETGQAFDPTCVAALRTVLAEQHPHLGQRRVEVLRASPLPAPALGSPAGAPA